MSLIFKRKRRIENAPVSVKASGAAQDPVTGTLKEAVVESGVV